MIRLITLLLYSSVTYLCHTDVCGANCEASLGAELHLHGKQGAARRRHKASQQPATGFPPECRVMSLAAAPLSDLTPSSSSSSSSSFPSSSSGCLHYLAVGCSDGIVRSVCLFVCLFVALFGCLFVLRFITSTKRIRGLLVH